MKLPNKYLAKFSNTVLRKKEQIDAFNKLSRRNDWRDMIKRAHEKLTEEYKFWVMKSTTSIRESKLIDINKDISFIKNVEKLDSLSDQQLSKLKDIVNKYNI